jgi:hypothetical protein
MGKQWSDTEDGAGGRRNVSQRTDCAGEARRPRNARNAGVVVKELDRKWDSVGRTRLREEAPRTP